MFLEGCKINRALRLEHKQLMYRQFALIAAKPVHAHDFDEFMSCSRLKDLIFSLCISLDSICAYLHGYYYSVDLSKFR